MASYRCVPCFQNNSFSRIKMGIMGCVCFALLSLLFGHPRAALSLNVDQARETLSTSDNTSYTVMHAPPQSRFRELAEEGDDAKEEEHEEDTTSSFLDETNEDADEEDDNSEDGKHSFLEDMEDSELEDDDEDYDLDAMDDEDAQIVAESMKGEERAAFLQRWEAHKADRQANGHPDERGSFAEF